MKLFLIRFLLAIAFYVCVPLVGQLSMLAGSVLVAGYRSLLIFSPYIHSLFGKYELLFCVIISIIGIINCFFLDFHTPGAFLIAIGLSIGGFILKAIAAETPALSGLNRMAITSGNIGAGVVFLVVNNHYIRAVGVVLILLISLCMTKSLILIERSSIKPLTIKTLFEDKISNLVWLFFGIAIGIRVFGMYIILPQHLIKKLGDLPAWYGLTLVLYGIIVILTQVPVVSKKIWFSLITSIIALGISCIIMCLPDLFVIDTFLGAMLWCCCLALEELFAPFIDFHAAKTNNLLVKEISIGIGGAICFAFAKTKITTVALGWLSIFCIFIGYLFYQNWIRLNLFRNS